MLQQGEKLHTRSHYVLLIMHLLPVTILYINPEFHFSETDVDAIDVCLEGRFLVVCERNGNLHLIYVPHKRILLTRV